MTAVFVMFAGIGIIGALASILASLLVAPAPKDEPAGPSPSSGAGLAPSAATEPSIAQELAGLRAEMAGQRAEIAALRAALTPDDG